MGHTMRMTCTLSRIQSLVQVAAACSSRLLVLVGVRDQKSLKYCRSYNKIKAFPCYHSYRYILRTTVCTSILLRVCCPTVLSRVLSVCLWLAAGQPALQRSSARQRPTDTSHTQNHTPQGSLEMRVRASKFDLSGCPSRGELWNKN